MAVTFRISPTHRFALFIDSGFVTLQESTDVVAACAAHPDHRPMMRQFCDLSQMTGVERNFSKLLKMQAMIVEDPHPANGEQLVLFYVPTAVGQELAQMARKLWQGLNSFIVLIQHHESEVMEMLGLQNLCLAALHQMG